MQRASDLFLLICDEREQARIIRCQMMAVPDEAIENVIKIGQSSEHFRRGQPELIQHLYRPGVRHMPLVPQSLDPTLPERNL